MGVFFTSDHHLGHRFVAGLRWKEFFGSNEPSSDQALLDWHDVMLAERWDQTVKKDDIVHVAGDLSLGTKDANYAIRWFKERPGRKKLYPGNHDPCHPMHKESSDWQRAYMEVFDSVELSKKLRYTVTPNEKKVTVLINHMPYSGDHTDVDRDTQWRLRDEGRWLLHGHLHCKERITGRRQIHIGLDAWDFSPVPLEEITKIIREAS